MSESDSFINEVTEEVRRDKVYVYVRKYGWIAAVAVIALVGGAAYFEFQKAQTRAAAEATGDALLAAMAENDIAARSTALEEIAVDGPAIAVTAMLTASSQLEAGNLVGAKVTLEALATNVNVPQIYRDVAGFKALLIVEPDTDPAARRSALDAMAQPGTPFRLLALEQLAMLDVAAGDTDNAIETLQAILEDAGVTRGLRDRAQTLSVALGVELDPTTTQ